MALLPGLWIKILTILVATATGTTAVCLEGLELSLHFKGLAQKARILSGAQATVDDPTIPGDSRKPPPIPELTRVPDAPGNFSTPWESSTHQGLFFFFFFSQSASLPSAPLLYPVGIVAKMGKNIPWGEGVGTALPT